MLCRQARLIGICTSDDDFCCTVKTVIMIFSVLKNRIIQQTHVLTIVNTWKFIPPPEMTTI